MKLVVACVECGKVTHASFDDERLPARRLFRETGYLLSAVREDPLKSTTGLVAPLCGECAPKHHTPELLAAAHQRLGVTVKELRCYYFGYRRGSGFCLQLPGGRSPGPESRELEYFYVGKGPEPAHLDATLAPRRNEHSADLCWGGSGATAAERRRIDYASDECPQGQFLRHELDTGFTAISWWDRNQGDTRPNCSSTILLEGKRDTEEMLEALRVHFPEVLANLDKAGVKLVEVFPKEIEPA